MCVCVCVCVCVCSWECLFFDGRIRTITNVEPSAPVSGFVALLIASVVVVALGGGWGGGGGGEVRRDLHMCV